MLHIENEIGEVAVTHILILSKLFLESSGKKHNRNNLPKASRRKLVKISAAPGYVVNSHHIKYGNHFREETQNLICGIKLF